MGKPFLEAITGPVSGDSIRLPFYRSWIVRIKRMLLRLFRSANVAPTVSTRFTREGLQVLFMAIFVLLGAIIRDVNLLIVLAGTLFATLLIQWRICAKTLNGLSTYRRLPRSMHARKAFEIELVIMNPKRWLGAWLVFARDRMQYVPTETTSTQISQAMGLLYLSIAPNSTKVQRYRCLAEKCGKYRFLGTELTTRFPFGLMRGILPHKGGECFIVQPAIGKLLPPWVELFGDKVSGARRRQARALSDEGDFFGLRAYRIGDSPRCIHWRSSARRNELMIKQFQQSDSRELVVLLDLFPALSLDKQKPESHQPTTELAVEFVATLVSHFAASNFGVITVAVSDAEPTLASRIQSRSQCSGLLDRLACSRSDEQDKVDIALNLLEREFRRVDNLLVISTRPSDSHCSTNHIHNGIIFWRSMTWLNANSGDLTKYFAPAE